MPVWCLSTVLLFPSRGLSRVVSAGSPPSLPPMVSTRPSSFIMGSIGDFAEEFWNVEVGDFGGWEVVSQRTKEAAKVTSTCVDFMKQVAAALDVFGKTLVRVAKSSTLPDLEHGELRNSLVTARDGVEALGQDATDAAAAVTSQANQLSNHLTDARLSRRRATEDIKKRQQQVKEGVRRVQHARRNAQHKMRDLVDAETHRLNLECRPDAKVKERDRDKACQAEERAAEALKEAESQHKETVKAHNTAVESWCSIASSAFRTLQDVEETRVRLVRDSFWAVANVCSLLAVHIDQHQDALRTALLQVDVGEEVAAWVSQHRTCQTQPIPLVYSPVPRPPAGMTPTSSARSTLNSAHSTLNSSARSTITVSAGSEDSGEDSPVPVRKARALYKFAARSGSEVCLKAGQAVVVMEGGSKEWSLVRTIEGTLGFVPTKFITPPEKEA
ncbi:proline-serine-threonine phosphatase-interacting protein 2-like isoform X2 [Portunus trituberculatus]|uniref:proline-serine-threonine phosphatase-interacting protein 2-like isoform X2 n=1 Tax=Portunus trituberculatus TaxID=210409 RepID=UPI001E1D0135|nr:proline-serine-threonine phosphatase-interacting protein 2-like isoform X2 [Portunus trituberculatus]